MAALFIVAGLAIADKVEKKKEARRLKKVNDEARYRELQIETSRRLARTQSGTIIESPEHGLEEEEEEDVEGELQRSRSAVDDAPPPAYEDAVSVGERRERLWRAKMVNRRRSSVTSGQSGERAGAGGGAAVRVG